MSAFCERQSSNSDCESHSHSSMGKTAVCLQRYDTSHSQMQSAHQILPAICLVKSSTAAGGTGNESFGKLVGERGQRSSKATDARVMALIKRTRRHSPV